MVYLPFGRSRLWSRVADHQVPEWAADFGAATWAQFFLKFVAAHPAAPRVRVEPLDAPVVGEVVVSTVPASAQDASLVERTGDAPVVFEVLYDPWPTPLAAAAAERGQALVGGLDLLVHQAALQFTAFTGVAAPLEAMRAAGERALAERAGADGGLCRRRRGHCPLCGSGGDAAGHPGRVGPEARERTIEGGGVELGRHGRVVGRDLGGERGPHRWGDDPDLGQRLGECIAKVGHAVTMLGGDRDRIAEPQRVGVEAHEIAEPALRLVGDQDQRHGTDDGASHYLAGDKAAAAAAVPEELLRATALIGDEEHVRERVGAFRAAGASSLIVQPLAPSREARIAHVAAVRGFLDELD